MSAREAARQLRHLMKPLDPWRFDLATDEICINAPGEAFVRTRGHFHRYDVALDYDDLYDIGVLAGALTQQNVGEANPLLGTDLPDGERLQVVLPPCVPQGTVSISLRIHSPTVSPVADATKRYDLRKWNRWSERKVSRRADYEQVLAAYDSGDIVRFLQEIVRLRFSPILCGSTGSGKTTMMKSLIAAMGPNERLITIENALELVIVNQPNHVRLLYSHGNQGVAKVTQKELMEAYLRMRPDRGSVGELRDPEAAYTYVSEAMTGHPGSPSTIHGRDASQAAVRLFNLFKASDDGRSYTDDMIKNQLGMTVDVIIPFQELEGRYSIGEVWLAPEAERRGSDIRELFG